jgi:GT2 family glycosyltransferase
MTEGNVERAYDGLHRALRPSRKASAIKLVRTKEPVLPDFRSLKKSPKPEVSVVLVTYNQWPFTELCLKSIALAQKRFPRIGLEVIVVDNCSSDETRARLREASGIQVVAHETNLGFAAGVNAGIRKARGENVALLNNDTVVPPDWLAQFLAHAGRIEAPGVIGPSSNTEILQSLPQPRYSGLGEFFRYASGVKNTREGEWDTLPKISGLCMFIPKAVIERVGLFSEEYGLGYFEDDDYCLRVREAGFKLVWAKDIYVHHFGSMSFEGNRISKKKQMSSAMKNFVFKWGKTALDHIAETQNGHLLRDESSRKRFF